MTIKFDCTHKIRSKGAGDELGTLGMMGAEAKDAEDMFLKVIADRAFVRRGPMFGHLVVSIETTLVWKDEP